MIVKAENFYKSVIPVVEIFKSVSGEGVSTGAVTTFIRVAGCNLRCSFCDTTYSYEESDKCNEFLTYQMILKRIESFNCRHIISTGGEPLEPDKPKRYLPLCLAVDGYKVRIETNGSCLLYDEHELYEYNPSCKPIQLAYALDIKCPGSGMSGKNIFEQNFDRLKNGDELKFIISNQLDFEYGIGILETYMKFFENKSIIINFSPVFGIYEPSCLAENFKANNTFFEKNRLNARLSLQLHKYIWPHTARGV